MAIPTSGFDVTSVDYTFQANGGAFVWFNVPVRSGGNLTPEQVYNAINVGMAAIIANLHAQDPGPTYTYMRMYNGNTTD